VGYVVGIDEARMTIKTFKFKPEDRREHERLGLIWLEDVTIYESCK
jgi:hypothetical protein